MSVSFSVRVHVDSLHYLKVSTIFKISSLKIYLKNCSIVLKFQCMKYSSLFSVIDYNIKIAFSKHELRIRLQLPILIN